jgi:hypothetical protein
MVGGDSGEEGSSWVRSRALAILPTLVRGSASVKTTEPGTL